MVTNGQIDFMLGDRRLAFLELSFGKLPKRLLKPVADLILSALKEPLPALDDEVGADAGEAAEDVAALEANEGVIVIKGYEIGYRFVAA